MNGLQDCALVVDDEALIADLWCMILEDMGLHVCGVATTAAEAISLAETHRPKLVLMDFRLKGPQDGVDAALAIGLSMGSKIIFITGSNEPETIKRIKLSQPVAILLKPLSDWQLEGAVNDAFRG